MSEERMQILEMISNGTISVEEASKLIEALEESEDGDFEEIVESPLNGPSFFEFTPNEAKSEAPQINDDPLPPMEAPASEKAHAPDPAAYPEPPMGFRKWQSFWVIPLAVGIVITVISGLLVYGGTRGDWNGFWMFCIWTPLIFGILVVLFGAMSRTARWVHIRVNTGQDEWPRRVAISLPLPLRFSAWIMQYFGHFIPGMDSVPVPVHELIMALQDTVSPEDPLHIKVDDSDGERVEVYIG